MYIVTKLVMRFQSGVHMQLNWWAIAGGKACKLNCNTVKVSSTHFFNLLNFIGLAIIKYALTIVDRMCLVK